MHVLRFSLERQRERNVVSPISVSVAVIAIVTVVIVIAVRVRNDVQVLTHRIPLALHIAATAA